MSSQAKKDEFGGAYSTHYRNEKCVQNLARRREGKTLVGSLRRRWEDNIRMDSREGAW
jgi:hypothetical protein